MNRLWAEHRRVLFALLILVSYEAAFVLWKTYGA